MKKIRILIVDDHPVVSEGLAYLLNLHPGLLVMSTASSARTGLEQLRKLQPDLVILDLSMPHLDGFDAIRLFLQTKPQLLIVIFSAHTEEKFVYQALQAGARGYVIKGSSPEDLKRAIYYIWEGGYWVSPQFSPQLIKNCLASRDSKDPERTALETLTDREQQVLRLLVTGKESEEISELLGISATAARGRRGVANGHMTGGATLRQAEVIVPGVAGAASPGPNPVAADTVIGGGKGLGVGGPGHQHRQEQPQDS